MKEFRRRTQLYVPGNSPSMIQHCMVFGSDGVLLDLEDSVSIYQKDAARELVAQALQFFDFGNVEVVVRINGLDTPYCIKDLERIIPLKPDAIRLPKTSSKDDILKYDNIISKIEKQNGLEVGSTKIVPMLETAVAIENAYEIAASSARIIAITIGGEDLTADMKVKRTKEGKELYWARAKVALAASAAKVASLDTVFSDVNDDEGLRNDTMTIKELGFDGKACINPRQIQIVHEVYTPSENEISAAKEIILAARKNEGGVVSLNGKMIDYPVVKRAETTLQRAGIDPNSI